jgi:alpha-beta hydrolase superfamily lysophospholipase
VLYFHGIQSHGGWYEESGSRLAEAGFCVLMPDRRGSGLNQVSRGHAESPEQIVGDASFHLDSVLKEAGVGKAHTAGVSWGGKLAVILAARQPERVASVSLIAPGIFPRIDLSTGEKFKVALSLAADRTRLFDIPLNDATLFTNNPERIEYVERDELKLSRVSATFLLTSRRLDREAVRLGRSDYRGPVHLFLAGNERIIDNERTREWLRDLPSEDRQITEYPEGHHTLEFESDPEAFFRDQVGWISQRQQATR